MVALFRASPERRRMKLAASAPPGPLGDYMAVPLPRGTTPLADLRLLAIDLETTGLEEHDSILSIGFIPVDGTEIIAAGANHVMVRHSDTEGVGQSATIHGITDDQLVGGLSLADALGRTLRALQGRCLLAHHAPIEVGFLTRACQQVWGFAPTFSVVDTLGLQHRILTHTEDEPPRGSLRLWNARDQFNLPRYKAHDALTDALAAGELYLAQVGHLGSRRLKDLKS